MFFQAILAGISLLQITSACGVPDIYDRSAALRKLAITNVLVWDGNKFPKTRSTVVIVGGIISNANSIGAVVVNGKGGYLIPGLIDSHVHLTDCKYLSTLQNYGVTTALDMGTSPYDPMMNCHDHGLTDIRGSGAAGTVNGTRISLIPGFPTDSFIPTPEAGKAFVAARRAVEVDYIKLFLDPLGPDDATIKAVVKAAHKEGLQVIGHATSQALYAQAARTGIDIITHAPIDKALDTAGLNSIITNKMKVVPTLLMMQSTINNTGAPYFLYTSNVAGSTKALLDNGVQIAAGTDSNDNAYVPANPPFGESLHEELALMVGAGFTPSQAIQAATSVPANIFKMYDRGSIKPGLRADLVLLTADPTVDIANTRKIARVWIEGVS
ncbi:amidohydrolase, partial [Cadophora sp. DSE1049]